MSGTLANGSSPDLDQDITCEEKRCQLQRILASKTFRASEQLRRLLEYLATAAIEGREEALKEYTIGTEVFGKQDFDPRQDTLVRTCAGRLRIRLETYYRGEGATDHVLLEIPKGHYIPRFLHRSLEADPSRRGVQVRRGFRRVAAGIAVAACLAVAAAGLYWFKHPASAHASLAVPDRGGSVAELWSRFIDPQAPVIASFSDHVSLIDNFGDQLDYKGPTAVPKGTQVNGVALSLSARQRKILKQMGTVFYDDGYTGTGEVVAVADLTRVFTHLGSRLIVRKSRLLLATDLRQHNVIFIGAPPVNGLLQDLPPVGNFVFEPPLGEMKTWASRILNRHPKSGEKASYGVERDPLTQSIQADHALVSFVPGIVPGRRVAVLAGMTTEGTQAAADFVTSNTGVDQIMWHLGTTGKNGKRVIPEYFQAVLRVEIAEGDVLRIRYVTGRVIAPQPKSP